MALDGSIAFAGVARQAELIRDGEISSRELVELYLHRIQRFDGWLNAMRVVYWDEVLAEADAADERRARGEGGPLNGVPIAVKDRFDVAGDVTTFGTVAHGPPARRDAEIVRRLRAAGAPILGKTQLPELAIWGMTESRGFGVTRNIPGSPTTRRAVRAAGPPRPWRPGWRRRPPVRTAPVPCARRRRRVTCSA